MAKTRNDEIYEQAVNDGKNAGILEQIAQGITPKLTAEDEIRAKGFIYGAQHKYDSSAKDSKPSESSSSSSSSWGGGGGLVILLSAVALIFGICTKTKEAWDSGMIIRGSKILQYSTQTSQHYQGNIILKGKDSEGPAEAHMLYAGYKGIELRYPLSRTNTNLEVRVNIPEEEIGEKKVDLFNGFLSYLKWTGPIGKVMDKDKNYLFSYGELKRFHDRVGKELNTYFCEQGLFVKDKDVNEDELNTVPKFYEDTENNVVDKNKLYTLTKDRYGLGKTILERLLGREVSDVPIRTQEADSGYGPGGSGEGTKQWATIPNSLIDICKNDTLRSKGKRTINADLEVKVEEHFKPTKTTMRDPRTGKPVIERSGSVMPEDVYGKNSVPAYHARLKKYGLSPTLTLDQTTPGPVQSYISPGATVVYAPVGQFRPNQPVKVVPVKIYYNHSGPYVQPLPNETLYRMDRYGRMVLVQSDRRRQQRVIIRH